jgi:hypothetical protein
MSGPAKFRILAIVGVICVCRFNPACSSLIQPMWRIYIPGKRFFETEFFSNEWNKSRRVESC